MPTIHLNGTSVETLIDENLEARLVIQDAIDLIWRMEFHMRDYPVDGSFDKAKAERETHLKAMASAADYFLKIAEHCADAQAERESRRGK